jgi:hypothetical protein
MKKPLHQALVSFLRDAADENDVCELHNEYASADDFIYNSVEDIADVFVSDDRTAIARMVFFGNVQSWNDRFFCLNGCANIDSFNHLTDDASPVDFDLLAKQVIEDERYDDVDFDAQPYLSEDE